MYKRSSPNFGTILATLRADRVRAHQAFYEAEIFGGPSLHFHREALLSAANNDLPGFATCAYAVLASWGMHRMGRGGSKMCEFEPFHESLRGVWPHIQLLRQAAGPEELDVRGWAELRAIFFGVKCMQSATTLVGNSKVMAHALPALVPPVDREYTLRFILGRKDIANDKHKEWATLELFLREFFHPAVADSAIRTSIVGWAKHADRYPWDTSPLKTVDNLVIGSVRLARDADKVAV